MNRLTEGDRLILKYLTEYVHLQPDHLTKLTGRLSHPDNPQQVIRRRLRALSKMGYARSLMLPDDQWAARVWFLSQKGYDFALEGGWIDRRIDACDEKSNKNLRHDLLVTEFHLALAEELPKHGCGLLFWEQHYGELHDNVDAYSINPDAFFGIRLPRLPDSQNGRFFYLEVERSRGTKYEHGEPALVRKLRGYLAYSRGAFQQAWGLPNFRVLTVFPSSERVSRFLEKVRGLRDGLVDCKFWFADEHVIRNPAAADFACPKAEAAHSLVR